MISSITLYLQFWCYGRYLTNATLTQPYYNAIQFMSSALAEATDLDLHHFQPCRLFFFRNWLLVTAASNWRWRSRTVIVRCRIRINCYTLMWCMRIWWWYEITRQPIWHVRSWGSICLMHNRGSRRIMIKTPQRTMIYRWYFFNISLTTHRPPVWCTPTRRTTSRRIDWDSRLDACSKSITMYRGRRN